MAGRASGGALELWERSEAAMAPLEPGAELIRRGVDAWVHLPHPPRRLGAAAWIDAAARGDRGTWGGWWILAAAPWWGPTAAVAGLALIVWLMVWLGPVPLG